MKTKTTKTKAKPASKDMATFSIEEIIFAVGQKEIENQMLRKQLSLALAKIERYEKAKGG